MYRGEETLYNLINQIISVNESVSWSCDFHKHFLYGIFYLPLVFSECSISNLFPRNHNPCWLCFVFISYSSRQEVQTLLSWEEWIFPNMNMALVKSFPMEQRLLLWTHVAKITFPFLLLPWVDLSHLHLEILWVSWRQSPWKNVSLPFPDYHPVWFLAHVSSHLLWVIQQSYPLSVPTSIWLQWLSLQVSRPSLCPSRFWVHSLPCNFNSLMSPRNVFDFPRKRSASCCGNRVISKLVMYQNWNQKF